MDSDTLTDADAIRCLDYIRDYAEKYAIAKANRQYLDKFRSTKRAILKAEYRITNEPHGKVTDGACDDYARGHIEYTDLLLGWKVAIEQEEKLKFMLIAAQKKIEVYQTISANNRGAIK